MDSHLGRALWRFSVDALTRLLTYGEGTRLPPPIQQPRLQRRRSPRSPRSPRAFDAFGVRTSRRASTTPSPAQSPAPTPTPALTPTPAPEQTQNTHTRRSRQITPEIPNSHKQTQMQTQRHLQVPGRTRRAPMPVPILAATSLPETQQTTTRKQRELQRRRQSARTPEPVRVRRDLYAPREREVRFDLRPVIMST